MSGLFAEAAAAKTRVRTGLPSFPIKRTPRKPLVTISSGLPVKIGRNANRALTIGSDYLKRCFFSPVRGAGKLTRGRGAILRIPGLTNTADQKGSRMIMTVRTPAVRHRTTGNTPLTSGPHGSLRVWGIRTGWLLLLLGFLAACESHSSSPGVPVPPTVTAIIENKGSDTLVNLALAWAEAFRRENPDVRISVTGGGTGTGIAAMINGTVNIANASREMKEEEKAAARTNGIDPVEFTVARDAIAVVVNPLNPVNRLTLQEISDIYTGKITNWKSVGGEDRPIVLLSRESNSGTYVYFLEQVIRMGRKSALLFSPETLLMPSSEGISSEVRQNPNAIGYDGLGYVTEDMKTVAVATRADAAYVLPAIATVNDGTYPISRSLYMYTAGHPTGKTAAFMDWIHTEGQVHVAKLGFVPIIK